MVEVDSGQRVRGWRRRLRPLAQLVLLPFGLTHLDDMTLAHQGPVFVFLSESKPHLKDVSTAVLTSLDFREAVSRIFYKPPYSTRMDPPLEWDFSTFALAVVKCSELRSLEIQHSNSQPIIALAQHVEHEASGWQGMQAMEFSYWDYKDPGVPGQLMRAILNAAPNMEELRLPEGCVGDDAAVALPNLKRVVHSRDNDLVVLALAGSHANRRALSFRPSSWPKQDRHVT